jgi:hypothetical protein
MLLREKAERTGWAKVVQFELHCKCAQINAWIHDIHLWINYKNHRKCATQVCIHQLQVRLVGSVVFLAHGFTPLLLSILKQDFATLSNRTTTYLGLS